MIGDIIKVKGIDLLVLDEINGNPFVIALDTGINTKFDDSCNNYAKSIIKSKTENWLAETGIQTIEREIDLITMDGYKGYGTLRVKAAPLTFDEYRKYADIIIPHIPDWFWLATGWGRPSEDSWASNFVCFVISAGAGNSDIYDNSSGLAPAFVLDKSLVNKKSSLSDFSTEELIAELSKRIQ